MFLIVGLGNPSRKYKRTRHNVGFRVLEEFQKENNFPKFKLDKKSKAEISKGIINGKEVLLAKPQTYMNNSGEAVKKIFNFQFSISNEFPINQFSNLIVVHDDFDLPLGEVKVSENAGSAGHHGVESIIQVLGTNNFKRMRIGTRPVNGAPGSAYLKAEDFVLKKFSKGEEKHLPEIIKNACLFLKENYEQN